MDTTRNDSEQGASAAESGTMERRAHPRAEGWGTAWIGIFPEGTTAMGYLLDLGLGGCRIEADEAIPAGDDTSVEVLLHLKGYTLRLAGEIRHLEDGKTRAGIEFTDVCPRKAEQIQRLLDQLIAELG
ncbi:MAG: PilZ domain-containing protein [Terracidiphilus sp.]